MAHLDVVEARREDWSSDPFRLTEKDGFFYGRGTSDIKDMAVIFAQAVIRLKREKVPLDRDVILALTADEEGGDDNGVQWLLAHRRDLIDADLRHQRRRRRPGDARRQGLRAQRRGSEKVLHGPRLEVRNAGGHSSVPVKDNAIYRLAAGLSRLSDVRVPASPERGDAVLFHPRRRLRAGLDRGPDAHGGRSRAIRPRCAGCRPAPPG